MRSILRPFNDMGVAILKARNKLPIIMAIFCLIQSFRVEDKFSILGWGIGTLTWCIIYEIRQAKDELIDFIKKT